MERSNFSLENLSTEERDLIHIFQKQTEDERKSISEEMNIFLESYNHATAEKQNEAKERFDGLVKDIVSKNIEWKMSDLFREASKAFLK